MSSETNDDRTEVIDIGNGAYDLSAEEINGNLVLTFNEGVVFEKGDHITIWGVRHTPITYKRTGKPIPFSWENMENG